jgi:hypothetical protein
MALNLKERLQQIDDRQIWRRLAIGVWVAFEDEPAVAPTDTDELIEQQGLAHTGIAHQPHHLPLSHFDMAEECLQDSQLLIPPHEPTQGSLPIPLQRGPSWAEPDDAVGHGLIDFPGARAPLPRP